MRALKEHGSTQPCGLQQEAAPAAAALERARVGAQSPSCRRGPRRVSWLFNHRKLAARAAPTGQQRRARSLLPLLRPALCLGGMKGSRAAAPPPRARNALAGQPLAHPLSYLFACPATQPSAQRPGRAPRAPHAAGPCDSHCRHSAGGHLLARGALPVRPQQRGKRAAKRERWHVFLLSPSGSPAVLRCACAWPCIPWHGAVTRHGAAHSKPRALRRPYWWRTCANRQKTGGGAPFQPPPAPPWAALASVPFVACRRSDTLATAKPPTVTSLQEPTTDAPTATPPGHTWSNTSAPPPAPRRGQPRTHPTHLPSRTLPFIDEPPRTKPPLAPAPHVAARPLAAPPRGCPAAILVRRANRL